MWSAVNTTHYERQSRRRRCRSHQHHHHDHRHRTSNDSSLVGRSSFNITVLTPFQPIIILSACNRNLKLMVSVSPIFIVLLS